jgi:hypothetical protein
MKQTKNGETSKVHSRNAIDDSSHNPKGELELCGPGCSCSGTPGSKRMKIVTMLLVVGAVVVALLYKKLS